MKCKHTIWLYALAIVTIIGVSVSACDNDTDAHTHEWKWVLTTVPTEIRDGKETKTCTTCGKKGKTRMRLPYTIGETGPAGGTIFYVGWFSLSSIEDGTYYGKACYYLEAAPVNEIDAIWGFTSSTPPSETYCNKESDDRIGNGHRNTQLLVNFYNEVFLDFIVEYKYAAQLCADANYGGYSDWFLPSISELNELGKLRGQYGIPNAEFLWSSSYYSRPRYAWGVNFDNGTSDDCNWEEKKSVRAVRAF